MQFKARVAFAFNFRHGGKDDTATTAAAAAADIQPARQRSIPAQEWK